MTDHLMYCHEPDCSGKYGIDVPWTRGTMIDPPEPHFDTCPHCGADLYDGALDEDVVRDAIEEAFHEHLRPNLALDMEPILVAIKREIERQSHEAFLRERRERQATNATALPF